MVDKLGFLECNGYKVVSYRLPIKLSVRKAHFVECMQVCCSNVCRVAATSVWRLEGAY